MLDFLLLRSYKNSSGMSGKKQKICNPMNNHHGMKSVMRKNADQNNSEYGNFFPSGYCEKKFMASLFLTIRRYYITFYNVTQSNLML